MQINIRNPQEQEKSGNPIDNHLAYGFCIKQLETTNLLCSIFVPLIKPKEKDGNRSIKSKQATERL